MLPTIASRKIFSRLAYAMIGVAWCVSVLVGMLVLGWYESQAGVESSGPPHWPGEAQIELSTDHPTLVMFAHPHCPCTRASIGELEELMARENGKLSAWVVFFKPSDAGDDWNDTDLQTTARSIPGVRTLGDIDGAMAERFHAFTSGETFLYSPRGELQFHGGITLARGHAGDNEGRATIESLVNDQPTETSKTPVFGCPIRTSEQP